MWTSFWLDLRKTSWEIWSDDQLLPANHHAQRETLQVNYVKVGENKTSTPECPSQYTGNKPLSS